MAKTTFKVGDLVKLKSGGPSMTVHAAATNDRNAVWCTWFAGKKVEKASFAAETLVLDVPKGSKDDEGDE